MGCGASSNQKEKYQFVKEETEKKKKIDEAEAAEKVAKAEEERRQAKRHDGADAQRKLSVSNITRVGAWWTITRLRSRVLPLQAVRRLVANQEPFPGS